MRDYAEILLTEGDMAAEWWQERNQERLTESEWKEVKKTLALSKTAKREKIEALYRDLDVIEAEVVALELSERERERLELRFIGLRTRLLREEIKMMRGDV